MPIRVPTSSDPVIDIGGKRYWLARDPKTRLTLYQSVTEQYQHLNAVKTFVNSDKIEVIWDDWSKGAGEGFYAQTMLATVPGRLYPPPTLNNLGSPGNSLNPIRWFFEEKDANGVWYLYAGSVGEIIKIDINTSTFKFRRIYGPSLSWPATFSASDVLGQPVKMYSARDGGNRWVIGADNANRFLVLDTVGTESSTAYVPAQTLNGAIDNAVTAIVVSGTAVANGDVIIIDLERMLVTGGGGTTNLTVVRAYSGTTAASHLNAAAVTYAAGDAWTAITAVTDGAKFFHQMPDGTVWRAVNTAKGPYVSACAAGADAEVNASWGAEFQADNIASPIYSLANYEALLIVGKADAYLVATKNPDNTLYWRSLLPDAQFNDTAGNTFGKPIVFHGKLLLPTPGNLWRHTLWSALPVGPDARQELTGDEAFSTGLLRFRNIFTCIDAETWLYGSYNTLNSSWLVAAKQPTGALQSPQNELTWYVIGQPSAPGTGVIQALWKQRNGWSGGRNQIIWFAYGAQTSGTGAVYANQFYWMYCAPDGNPFYPNQNSPTYGKASATDTLTTMPILFPAQALLREMQLVIEQTDANYTWSLNQSLDGGNSTAVGSGITSTGSIYWTARSNDTCRRAQFQFVGNSNANFTPSNTPPRLMRASLLGHLLPSVGAEIQATVDLRKTAKARSVSEKQVRIELKNNARFGSLAFLDPHGFTGNVLLEDVQEAPYPFVAGLEGQAILGLRMTLLKYATTFSD